MLTIGHVYAAKCHESSEQESGLTGEVGCGMVDVATVHGEEGATADGM
jgi:hypothetical protein